MSSEGNDAPVITTAPLGRCFDGPRTPSVGKLRKGKEAAKSGLTAPFKSRNKSL
jgi:hypothetical protein